MRIMSLSIVKLIVLVQCKILHVKLLENKHTQLCVQITVNHYLQLLKSDAVSDRVILIRYLNKQMSQQWKK